MLATISIACFNKDNVTKRCLDTLLNQVKDNVEFVLINNGSQDHTEHVILTSKLKNKLYITFGENKGFPEAHNEALKVAKGEFFVILNNDLIFKDDNWLYQMIEVMEKNPNVAIVGLSGTPDSLRDDGYGYVGGKKEYVEGSCFMGRTKVFQEYGLFNPIYKMFFFEDSDLSLRYRQAGFDIAWVPIPHEHVRGQTVSLISPHMKSQIMTENQKAFLHRWGRYLTIRAFTKHILVKMMSHGGGDLIAMSPLLEAIRIDHPKSTIELETNWPEIFQENPFVDKIFGPRKSYTQAFDRTIEVNPDYSSYNLIIDMCEKKVFTKPVSKHPQLFLQSFELNEGAQIVNQVRGNEEDVVIAAHLQMTRSGWAGRNWNRGHAAKLFKMLRQAGVKVVELGKDVRPTGMADLDLVDQINLRQMFSVVANCDMFVGIDSMPFHVAQAYQKPSFILFGATSPCSRVIDFTKTCTIRNDTLPCIGCYQKKAKPVYNECFLGTEECMNGIQPETVFAYIMGEINPLFSNINYLQERLRRSQGCN